MKSPFISNLRTFALLGFGILSSHAQDVAPTSVELSKSFTPIFKQGKIEQTMDAEKEYANFRFIAEYDAKQAAYLVLRKGSEVELPAGEKRKVEVTYEHSGNLPARYRVWVDGLPVEKVRDIPNSEMGATSMSADNATSTELIKMDKDFTMMVEFTLDKKGSGGLVAKTFPMGKWEANCKALYVKDNKLIYEVAEVGKIESKSKLNPGAKYVAVVTSEAGRVSLFINGKLEGTGEKFSTPDPKHPVFHIGMASDGITNYFKGNISGVRFWGRVLNAEEIGQLSKDNAQAVNTPEFNWIPNAKVSNTDAGSVPGHPIRMQLEILGEFEMHRAVLQPLAVSDHEELVKAWDKKSLERGKTIYSQLCVTCHGTLDQPGSLPTAPRFHLGDLKNGSDPYRMFQTLEKGYGQMTAMPQYTTAQKYDVIHYIREEFLKGKNDKYYTAVDAEYLASLPRGMSQLKEESKNQQPQYLLQDYGNTLFWTLQVEKGNIAQKGLTVRLDAGLGGVSKGNAWMLYEHDTMRVAAIWTGKNFVDWKGIAFDGTHGSHTSIVGEKHFVFPNEPAWANPETGDFKDLRIIGRDKLPYGPLPRSWVRFKGLEVHGPNPVIRYSVGDCEIREIPKLAGEKIFERWFYCEPSSKELKLRLDDKQVHVLPPSKTPFSFGIRYQAGKAEVFELPALPPIAIHHSKRFEVTLTTQIKPSTAKGAWAVDTFEVPDPTNNPWQSWMRTSGFDFFEGGKSAAICTWNGEVWIVDGIDKSQGELKWQLICTGLFQPLGLKIIDGKIYVTCRDMIALLRDTNGDRETDFIESFNSDHQVTEHFHEFAMGLQADAEGNLYYAKSARHAKTAIVPHHGTLLKVSKDGSKTEILANGFRAANGVCLNPDGSFMVTDQEGNWTPKNRINWVKPKGDNVFYGNLYGYHNVTDESDTAMKQPLCWITNKFDRSPAELLWVPENSAWKSLHGSLINLSYGEGKIYTVPFETQGEEVQGGMSPLGMEPLPTGLMRGRFSPVDGQLYGCGMFAWAGNRQQPGGFYRIRYSGEPAYQPVSLSTKKGQVTIGFSDPLDPATVAELSSSEVSAWDLKRNSGYGSKHLNERKWTISKAELSKDGKTITLDIPELAPTWGMSMKLKLRGAGGVAIEREIHNSIFTLD